MTLGVVLGGGGIAGVAWEAGIVLGLQQAGADLSAADVIVGTSAGSIVGSHLAFRADLRALAPRQPGGQDGPGGGAPGEQSIPDGQGAADGQGATGGQAPPDRSPGGAPPGFDALMVTLAPLWDPALDPVEARRRVGAAALAADAGGEEAHIARIAALLPAREEWPPGRFLVTAIDTATGELTVWERGSGVPLDRAVASSCAVPGVYPPVTIGGRRYMDGGIRSGTNADLAAGASAVIVLDAIGHLTPREGLRAELATLGASRTLVLTPDDGAAAAMGTNLLDPVTWAPALDAGLAQAASCAEAARALWAAA